MMAHFIPCSFSISSEVMIALRLCKTFHRYGLPKHHYHQMRSQIHYEILETPLEAHTNSIIFVCMPMVRLQKNIGDRYSLYVQPYGGFLILMQYLFLEKKIKIRLTRFLKYYIELPSSIMLHPAFPTSFCNLTKQNTFLEWTPHLPHVSR